MDNYGLKGAHGVLYYCGIEHMLVNAYDYLSKGIENKQLVYLYVEPEFYKIISENFHMEDIHIEAFNIPSLIQLYSNKGVKYLTDYFFDCEKRAKDEGYMNIKIINQVSYLLKEVSNEEFLNFEKILTEAIKGKNISIMCAYNFDDYIKERAEEDTLFKESLNNHNYRFYKFKLIKSTSCI